MSAEAELQKDIMKFYADPLGFVRYAYPWGQAGTSLQNESGPDKWQIEILKEIGAEVKARRFTGHSPVTPIRVARSSGHGVGKGHGKSLILNTPNGIKKWGDLNKGDSVFSSEGTETKIKARHELGIKQIYKVAFDDGSYSFCTLEHLWNVRGRKERRRALDGWRTLSAEDILEIGILRRNGVTQAKQWEIPIQGQVEFEQREIDLHPYFIGLWLGDGTKGQPAYAKPFPELVGRLRDLGLNVSEASDGVTKRILGIAHLMTDPVFKCGSPERYIPDDYKFNSAENRRELLRGLLDSDGECGTQGSIGYSSTSKQLAEDVIWLVRSLGGKAMMQEAGKHGWYPDGEGGRVECRDCYRVTINLDWNPFTIEHRKARWKPSEHRYMTRWIESIEYSHDEDAMCITVEAEDGLYLANDFIVTHNSTLVAWLVDWIMSTRPNCKGTVTANTFTQLETKTWAQIQTWTKLCITAHWFTVTGDRMYYTGKKESWFVSAQSCKEENSEAFAGQHAAQSTSFYIFDEASAISDSIYEVAEGGLTDGEPMIFMFGNPTKNSGKFFRSCFGSERDKSRWLSACIDSRESKISNKVTIAEWAEDYGEDSDFFRVRVLGIPPRASDAQFIDQERVLAAQKRTPIVLHDEPLVVGCDFAWGGEDNNVIRFRRGHDARSIPAIRIPGEKTREPHIMVGKLAEVLSTSYDGRKVQMLFVDSCGIAGAVVPRLRELGHKNIAEVNFMADAPDYKCANMRSYMWRNMRDWLIKGAIDNPQSMGGGTPQFRAAQRLADDLVGPGYKFNSKVQLLLEKKEDMKKRDVDSPDDGDALALTFAHPVIAKKVESSSGRDHSSSNSAFGWMA